MRPQGARVLALAAVASVALAGCALPGARVPFPAPDFRLTDTDGEVHDLARYEGRVLVLDLMATWCVPCVAEMRHLRTVREAYPEDRVAILSVGTDTLESDAALERFRDRHGGTWAFARDTDGVARKYGLRILPKLAVVDPDGVVVFENHGETYPAALARVLNRYVEPEGP